MSGQVQKLKRSRRSKLRSKSKLDFVRLEDRNLLATWTALNHAPPTSLGTMMLQTDGTVLAQGTGQSSSWYHLTPDSSGSYVNGTWSAAASMSQSRLYYGSNVLPDGRVYVLGGEYSSAGGWTNTGEIYNPLTNSWSAVANFPAAQFGDGQTNLLPDGRIIAGNLANTQCFIYNPTTNSWSATGSKLHNDKNNEETWTLLPDGDILSYDVWSSVATGIPRAQRWDFASGVWTEAGILPSLLSTAALGYEIGAAVRLTDGRIFQIGGNSNTALYNPTTNTWTAGPTIPGGKGADDAPAAIMPNGHVLLTADTPLFNPPTRMFDFDPNANTITDITATLPAALQAQLSGIEAYRGRMLMLPTGQMLFSPDTFAGGAAYIYTPDGGAAPSLRPTVISIAQNSQSVFTLTGTQLTGQSAGAAYGEDAEMDTNYPIVQLTNGSNVYYARSFNWTPGVGTGANVVTTQFQTPTGLPQGTYSLRVIASGIASDPFTFTTFVDLNDQISEAIPIGIGTTTNGSISWAIDVNMYKFSAIAGDVIDVDLDIPGLSVDTVLRLFDPTGNQLLVSDDDVGPGNEYYGLESYFQFTVPVSGNYYLGVSNYPNFNYDAVTGNLDVGGGSLGAYELLLDYADLDDQISEATSISLGSTVAQTIEFGADVDMFAFAAIAGQTVDVDLDVPGANLDTMLRIFDGSGNQLGVSDDDAGHGKEYYYLESYLRFTAPTTGLFYFAVSAYPNVAYDPNTGRGDTSGYSAGNYQISVTQVAATAINREVYYKGSTVGAGVNDRLDNLKVIAKEGGSALTLSYNNIINVTRGINGMVLDYNFLASASLANSDFVFQMSPQGGFDATLAANQPANWGAAPSPTLIAVSALGGSTSRIRLEWADNSIENRWLRVTVKANANTGLATPDVYYIGHLKGEISGLQSGSATTQPFQRFFVNNGGDVVAIRNNLSASAVPITSIYDLSKNGTVTNGADVVPARNNLSTQLTNIQIPASGPSANFGSQVVSRVGNIGFSNGWIYNTVKGQPRQADEMVLDPNFEKSRIQLKDDLFANVQVSSVGNLFDAADDFDWQIELGNNKTTVANDVAMSALIQM